MPSKSGFELIKGRKQEDNSGEYYYLVYAPKGDRALCTAYSEEAGRMVFEALSNHAPLKRKVKTLEKQLSEAKQELLKLRKNNRTGW